MKKSPLRNIALFFAILVTILIVAYLLSGYNKPERISYDELISKIESQEVEAIYITSYSVSVKYKDSLIKENEFPKRADAELNIGYRTALEAHIYALKQADPDFVVPNISFDDPTEGNIWSTLIPIFGIMALGLLLFFMFRQSQGSNNKALNFGKTKARINQNIKVRFSDVAGAEEEKEELAEIVEFLKSPKKFIEVGARIPKGVLLVGSPGTGKTLFAKAVAGEANVPFFSISGSDFVEMFVGVGASRVRDLFDQAKKNMPCIIFIDEIDAVGRQRGAGLGGGHDEREQTLNQLLVQMDGFETNDGIIIMAATNRADILDPALLRPGRFDRQIYVHIPDVRGREAIFKVHARNKPLSGDINFKTIARLTSGFTGADIENLLNEAAILAARANRKIIIKEDLYEGINKVLMGTQKKSRVVTETDKRITAYHEVGHAILARLLPHCDEVQEISIIPRGMAAGYTLTRPENDDNHMSRNKLIDIITMMLGGRAAEQIVIKDISTGASNDIMRATAIAKSMVAEWGMSAALGTSAWGTSSHEVFLGRDFQTAQNNISEEIAGRIDNEIKKIMDEAYDRAVKMLSDSRDIMDNMVKLLYERETIYADEVELLFKNCSVEDVLVYIKNKEEKQNSALKITVSDLIVSENEQDKNGNILENADNDAKTDTSAEQIADDKDAVDSEPTNKAEQANPTEQSEENIEQAEDKKD